MPNVFKELLSSKKALVLLASGLAWGLGRAGLHASPDDLLPLVGLGAAYLVGQGIADHGKSRAQVEAAGRAALEQIAKTAAHTVQTIERIP